MAKVLPLKYLHQTEGTPTEPENLTPKSVQLEMTKHEYQRILKGPPDTVTMRSGFVVLQPHQSVGKHTTGDYEEVLIVLAGQGEMRVGDSLVLNMQQNSVLYCPPATEHDVFNVSEELLKYIYIVAKAR